MMRVAAGLFAFAATLQTGAFVINHEPLTLISAATFAAAAIACLLRRRT